MKSIWHHRMIVFIAVAVFALAACSSKEDAAKPQAAAQDQPAAQTAQAQDQAEPASVQQPQEQAEAEAAPAADQEQMQSEAAPAPVESVQEQAQAAEETATDEVAQAQPTQSTPPASIPEVLEITGKVEKTEEGIVIATNMANYFVLGRNLTDMVGQTVNVTGAVEEANGRYTINVMSVTETE